MKYGSDESELYDSGHLGDQYHIRWCIEALLVDTNIV